jgi:hypothetical protein
MGLKLWLSLMLFFCLCPQVQSDSLLVGHIVSPFYNIYRPQTKEEIYSSYRVLVDLRDGVSQLEARLIAQYEAAVHDLDHGYEIGKPKVIEETSSQWKVRIPSKFSINDHKKPPDFIICISKQNAKILCFGEQTVN